MKENQNFKDLPLSDPLIFEKVMSQKDLTQMFLEELLQHKIPEIINIGNYSLISTTNDQDIRTFFVIQCQDNTNYYITVPTRDDELPFLARVVCSLSDMSFFDTNGKEAVPPDIYMIFVCNFDCFGDGLPKYSAESYLQGKNGLTIPYDDGRYTIALNAQYRKEDGASPAILEFLDYFRDEDDAVEFKTVLAQKLRERTKAIRENKGE